MQFATALQKPQIYLFPLLLMFGNVMFMVLGVFQSFSEFEIDESGV